MKTTALIVIAIVVLGAVSIFTAYRLYQLRNQSVSLNAPENVPAATLPPTESPNPTPSSLTVGGSEFNTATASPSATPIATIKSTSTPIIRATPVPTSKVTTLPQAGIDWPTWMGIGASVFFVISALLLIL
ncbi:hypothetical protein HYS03_02110 [Candidatus Woesebacteria bacterium]|nr:hypothetical protein [Candidatus Woesebacteria bacterium]QQG47734.1 MAG: hypothetical protein HY044_01435 [Candidatus Woesebacteria bacterium]